LLYNLFIETSPLPMLLSRVAERFVERGTTVGYDGDSRYTPLSTLEFFFAAAVRYAADSGRVCLTNIPKDELVPPLGALNLQCSGLSLAAAFVFGRALSFAGRRVRDSVQILLRLAARLTGMGFALAFAGKRWPTVVTGVSKLALGISWLVGTSIGASVALVPVPASTHQLARSLDELTQQAQRLRVPVARLLLLRFWRYWRPARGRFVGYGWLRTGGDHSAVAAFAADSGGKPWRWEYPDDLEVPHDLCCPITWQLLADPVVLHGDVFERGALEVWLQKTPRHPLRADTPAHLDEMQAAEAMARLCFSFARTLGFHPVAL